MKASYVIKRILLTLFIFFIVITLCFFIPRIGVVDPASRYYPVQSAGMTDEEYEIIKEAIRVQYGLDGSTFEQYIRYLGRLFTGDLGTSYQSGNPKVIDLIASRLPWTLVLSVSNLLISLIIGILIGTMAAWKRGRWQDRALLNASTFTTALPAFFIALILSFYLGFEWEIFPAYTDQNMVAGFEWTWECISQVAYNAALPVFAMAIGGVVSYGQATRNSVIAVSEDDFIKVQGAFQQQSHLRAYAAQRHAAHRHPAGHERQRPHRRRRRHRADLQLERHGHPVSDGEQQ